MVERPRDLSAGVRSDLAHWLLALADNKRVLGLRYAEWCTGAPELEADVAISAMAQYELGHARLLRGLLGELPEDPRSELRRDEAAAWSCMAALDRPASGWAEVIVLNALIDNLLTVNLQAATAGGVRLLAQRLRKAVSEEGYHALHARAWMERLLAGPEHIVERVRDAVTVVFPQCLAWFGPDTDNALDRLAAADVIDVGARPLRDRYLDVIAPLFQADVRLPIGRNGAWVVDCDLDWSNWSERTRRAGQPDFDAESLAMLTGAHARAIGVAD